jgi:hypothetical protein
MTKNLINNSMYLPYNPELKERASKKPPLSERGLGDFYLQFLFFKLKNN